jgi:hypothetical protein
MTLLALLLAALGAADLVRPRDRVVPVPAAVRAVLVAGAVTLVLTTGLALGVHVLWLVPLATALSAAWVLTTPVAGWGSAYPWPLVGLLAAAVAALAVPSPRLGDGWLLRWYDGLDLPALAGVDAPHALLGAAALVHLVGTSNVLVRMVLTATGAEVIAQERSLQGGRVLGPIERIFLFAMALAGEYGALAAVVAAKGILRFPEISRDAPGHAAEYVLVGSFVSWASALVLVPLF